MKHVFPNHQVAHIWAQQTQSDGRSHNGNLFFEGRTIYSYGSLPIAMFVKNTRGEEAVLMTQERYSVTTQHHKSIVLGAIHHKNVLGVFSLRALRTVIHDGRVNSKIGREVLKGYASDFEKLWARARRSQAHNREYYFNHQMPDAVIEAQRVADFFRCKNPVKMPDLTEHRRHLAKLIETADARAEKRKARIKSQMEGHLLRWRDNADYPLPREASDFMTDADKALSKERLLIRHAVEIAEWREGKRAYISAMAYRSGYWQDPVYLLRLIADGTEIETSGGARFPTEHGKKAFELIRQCHDRGEGFKRNGHSIHLGTFVIDEITAEGHVRAGCHFVRWDEIEAMAKKLGIF